MNLNNFFIRKISLLLFFFSTLFLLKAQNDSKFDRNFKVILENKDIISKGKKSAKDFKVSPYGLDGITSKNNGEVLYSCIIYTTNAQALKDQGIQVQSILPKFVTALVSLKDLEKLQNIKEAIYIKSPKILQTNNDIAVAQSGASLLQSGVLNNTVYKGSGILVGILDSGIDWKHPDFKDPTDPTKSRILSIWDQTITPTGTEVSPATFTYGVEYTQADINNELSGVTAGFIREADSNGHGTHVAGTAAGNGASLASKKYAGMAPEANLVIVKAGDGSFKSSNIINGLSYFNNVATALNKPIVVNMSLGGQSGPHDGTGDEEDAVDFFSNSKSGRTVVISAGNDNGTNIHKQLILSPGATGTISLTLASNTTATDFFAFNVYSNNSSDFTGSITSPTSEVVTTLINDSSVKNVMSNSFTVFADNYIDNANNLRFFDVYLKRYQNSTTDVGGTWTISITNNGVSPITLDGWKYYTGTGATVTVVSGDSNYLVGSPGDAKTAITVGAYSGKLFWRNEPLNASYAYTSTSKSVDNISTFSSKGPLKDGTQKPEISAPGEATISCLATGTITSTSTSNVDGTYYKISSGTSMSSPVVTGAVALLYQIKPTATYTEIKNLITSTAQKDNATGMSLPNFTWGSGKLDVYQAATKLAGTLIPRKTYINETYPYALSTDSSVLYTTERIAERFSPDISGFLGGVFFNTSTTYTGVDSFTIEVRANNAGVPGSLLASKSIDPTTVSKYNWNYYDLSSLKIPVVSGTDYFIVIYTGSATNSQQWTIRKQASNSTGNRSQLSIDNGVTWSASTLGYRIRSEVYGSTSTNLSVNEIDKDNVTVYPNPAKDLVNIKLPNAQKSDVMLFDLSGKLLKQFKADSNNIELSVSNLPKGVYILKISSNTSTVTKKIIKE